MMQLLRRIIRNRSRRGATAGIHDLISAIDEQVRGPESIEGVVSSLDAARDALWGYLRRGVGSPVAAKALTLKILNLLLAKREFLARSTSLLSRPYGLLVDPSNSCNLACPGCVHSTAVKALKLFDWNKGLLSEARFRGLMQHYGGYAFQVLFCNYGEPITNPNTPRLVEIAKSYLVQTVLSTSLAIARLDAEAYVRSGLDFMILSIDGATQKVYERYRKNGNLEIVYRNIDSLVRAKRTLKKRTPVIRWQFLAFEHNAYEIPLALKTAQMLGVDQFTVETPFNVSWDDPDVRPAEVPPLSVEFELGTEEKFSENYGVHLDEMATETIGHEFEGSFVAKLAQHLERQPVSTNQSDIRSDHTCHWLYKNMVMDANGRILPCASAPRPDAELVFSTFTHERPEDCFNSELYQEARLFFADKAAYQVERAVAGGIPGPYCAGCEWNQLVTDIGGGAVAQALRTFGEGLIDSRTIGILSDW
jgi:MoaA/NifB/PqqE/SkfB family radical SAM enzyme